MNILAAISLVQAIASKGDIGKTLADLETVASLYQQAKAGKLDLAVMVKAGTLKPALQAISELSGTLAQVMDDPAQAAIVEALVSGLN